VALQFEEGQAFFNCFTDGLRCDRRGREWSYSSRLSVRFRDSKKAGDFGFTTFGREGFDGLVIASRIGVGTLREKELHDACGHGFGGSGQHERRVAAVVANVDNGALIQKELDRLFVTGGRGGGEGASFFFVTALTFAPLSMRRATASGLRLPAAAMRAVAPVPITALT
jgi:hypothetical protein